MNNFEGSLQSYRSYVATAEADLSVGSSVIAPTTVEALKSQQFYLAEHDIYGSSRVGVKDYNVGQVGQIWTASVSGTGGTYTDTTRLKSRLPWYSYSYADVITNDSLTQWGNGYTGAFYAQYIRGQKQYELTDHLGDVLATVSDKRAGNIYAPIGGGTLDSGAQCSIDAWKPIVVTAHDYYPFGEYMPGRSMSDTTTQCYTATLTEMVPVVYYTPFVLWDPATHLGGAITIGTGVTLSSAAGGVFMSVSSYESPITGSGLSYDIGGLSPGISQQFILNIPKLAGRFEILVTDDNTQMVVGSTEIDGKGSSYYVPFTPVGSSVTLSLTSLTDGGSVMITYLGVPHDTIEPQSVITTLCMGDYYRYGFNGQMKDNEYAGLGNHVDFGERGLDTRTGRWPTPDKLAQKYPGVSPYAFALNSPIQAKDPDGRVVIFVNGQHGNTGLRYWAQFDTKVMNWIGDHNSRYYDGALGGWSNTATSTGNNNLSAENRFMAGYKQGMADARDIINHLQRDDEGNITESVKIISHSMGGAYAKGFTAALNHYAMDAANNEYLGNSNPMTLSGHPYYPDGTMKGFNIEYEVDFAPFQPNNSQNTAIAGIRTIQVSHKADGVVNSKLSLGGSYETKEKGVSLSDYHLNNDPSKGHSIQDFKDEINYVPQSSSNGGGGSSPAPSAPKESDFTPH